MKTLRKCPKPFFPIIPTVAIAMLYAGFGPRSDAQTQPVAPQLATEGERRAAEPPANRQMYQDLSRRKLDRLRQQLDEHENENDRLRARIRELEEQIARLERELVRLKRECRRRFSQCEDPGSAGEGPGEDPLDEVGEPPEITPYSITNEIPEFEWPPPRPSAQAVIPDGVLGITGADAPRLGQVDANISDALDASGYYDRSYYAVPGGYAMATRMERINRDGTPIEGDERWALEGEIAGSWSLETYVRALFTSNPGYFRVIVFVVTDRPFTSTDEEVSQDTALAWLQSGANELPRELRQTEYSERHSTSTLIYEFEKIAERDPRLLQPGLLQGRTHLERADIWGILDQ